jgi:peptidoglycan/LPS O-acetylase OafA/YrhL
MKYVPGLDGLRALAVLGVVLCHSGAGWARGGFIGVDVFFVLSGYLITRLLAETQPTLRQFYYRRLRRLTPPLALMLAAYLVVFSQIRPDHDNSIEAGLSILYLSDYAATFWGLPEYLRHTWSLSVEEHFYLLWPLVFYRFRPTVKMLTVAFVLATLWRLGIGSWGAFLAVYMRWADDYTQGPGITTAEIAAAVAVLGAAPKWLESAPLTYLGKLSYGIYLWHYPIARLMDGQLWPHVLAVTLPASILLAALSYHTLEAYTRRPRIVYG